MAKKGHVRISPNASSQIQEMGERIRVRRHNIYSFNHSDSKTEVIRNVPVAIQNKLRDRRAARREREKIS